VTFCKGKSIPSNMLYIYDNERSVQKLCVGLFTLALIKEASQLLPECKFTHVRREVNQVAHARPGPTGVATSAVHGYLRG
jgi:hypothetical protein